MKTMTWVFHLPCVLVTNLEVYHLLLWRTRNREQEVFYFPYLNKILWEAECHQWYCLVSSWLCILWNDTWRHLWSTTRMFNVFFISSVCSFFTVLLCVFVGHDESRTWLLFKRHRNMQIVQRSFKFQQGWLSPRCQKRERWLRLSQSDGMLLIQAWHKLHRQNKYPKSLLGSTSISWWNSFDSKQVHTLPVQHTVCHMLGLVDGIQWCLIRHGSHLYHVTFQGALGLRKTWHSVEKSKEHLPYVRRKVLYCFNPTCFPVGVQIHWFSADPLSGLSWNWKIGTCCNGIMSPNALWEKLLAHHLQKSSLPWSLWRNSFAWTSCPAERFTRDLTNTLASFERLAFSGMRSCCCQPGPLRKLHNAYLVTLHQATWTASTRLTVSWRTFVRCVAKNIFKIIFTFS